MASERINSILQEELDISTKITNLEQRASNLETEFSDLLQTARQLAMVTKRRVERMEIENKCCDLLQTMFDSEVNSREIMDHLRLFFYFLLGRLQRNGAEITDLFMLWPLIETDGIRDAFKDSVLWFGFKDKDIPLLKILLAAVYKYHKQTIEGLVQTEGETHPNSKSEDKNCNNQQAGEPVVEANPIAEESMKSRKNYAAVAKYVFSNQAAVPLHYAPVDDILVKDDSMNIGIDLLSIDNELRAVLKRAVAIVLYTLNIGRESVKGLYSLATEMGDKNNSADVAISIDQECLKDQHSSADVENFDDQERLNNQNNNADVVIIGDKESLKDQRDDLDIMSIDNQEGMKYQSNKADIVIVHDQESLNEILSLDIHLAADQYNSKKVSDGKTGKCFRKNENRTGESNVQSSECVIDKATMSAVSNNEDENQNQNHVQKPDKTRDSMNESATSNMSDTISEDKEIELLELNISPEERLQSDETSIDDQTEAALLSES